MKKLLRIAVILVVGRFGYRYIVNHQNAPVVQPTGVYTFKTVERKNMPGQDIHVYDQSGKEIMALVNEDPQYPYKIVNKNLIIDLGTSASQRTVAIYDIPTGTKIFTSSYYPSDGNSLSVKKSTVQFYVKIRNEYEGLENKPSNAPSCSAEYNGYTETRIFDMTTKKLQTTGIFTCAYFE